MSDKVKIIAGLAVFLALVTFPVWYMMARGDTMLPELEPPAGALLFTTDWSSVSAGSGDGLDLKSLGNEFGKNRVLLSRGASFAPGEDGDKWRIVDGKNRYLVRKSGERVEIYAGCVKDREYMNPNHMNILNEWRDDVVRKGDRSKVEINGLEYEKSLTKCCMKCHTSREKFCFKCHEYADVLPPKVCPKLADAKQAPRGVNCWNCHVEPKGD